MERPLALISSASCWILLLLLPSDWYERALAQPQLVLQDLLTILHPNMMPENIPAPHFFYNVAKV